MNVNEQLPNLYRAKLAETGEIHFFVGTYDERTGEYVSPDPQTYAHVIGDRNSVTRFSTFAEAMDYLGYKDYNVASQAAFNRYGGKEGGYSKVVGSGWDQNLGEGYVPWIAQRRGRRVER